MKTTSACIDLKSFVEFWSYNISNESIICVIRCLIDKSLQAHSLIRQIFRNSHVFLVFNLMVVFKERRKIFGFRRFGSQSTVPCPYRSPTRFDDGAERYSIRNNTVYVIAEFRCQNFGIDLFQYALSMPSRSVRHIFEMIACGIYCFTFNLSHNRQNSNHLLTGVKMIYILCGEHSICFGCSKKLIQRNLKITHVHLELIKFCLDLIQNCNSCCNIIKVRGGKLHARKFQLTINSFDLLLYAYPSYPRSSQCAQNTDQCLIAIKPEIKTADCAVLGFFIQYTSDQIVIAHAMFGCCPTQGSSEREESYDKERSPSIHVAASVLACRSARRAVIYSTVRSHPLHRLVLIRECRGSPFQKLTSKPSPSAACG